MVPLRPLNLTDVFNGAVAYIRANPKATLGLATVVVVAAQIISLAVQLGPLSALGQLDSALQGESASAGTLAVFAAGTLAGVVVSTLASLLLSGMLTIVVGRSVFGGTVTIGEAWQRLRPRLLSLIGLTALQSVAFGGLAAAAVVVVVVAAQVGGSLAAFALGAPLFVVIVVALLYASTVLLFAPPVIVLEQRGILASIGRSFRLVSKDFWRIFGIWALAGITATVIAWGVGAPFSVVGELLSLGAGESTVPGLVLTAVGGAIGQIVTAPFSAGVVVLLYADRRFRSEALDLMVQTGMVGVADPAAVDQLWLPRYF